MSVDLPTPAVALAIAAHPDDVEFHCGATLARWSRQGTVVHHLICTDGSKGTWDPDADLGALVARRQAEQRAAAAALGATGEVVFLGAVDGELTADRATLERVVLEIRRLRPEVVLAHDPWKRYRLHPDHRTAGQLSLDAVVAARDPHFFRHQPHPHHRPRAVLLFEAQDPDHLEVATEADLAARVAALEAHESQIETTHLYGLDGGDDPLTAFREDQRATLAAAAAPFGAELGEAFHLIDDL